MTPYTYYSVLLAYKNKILHIYKLIRKKPLEIYILYAV